jgi:hypothetical protein
MKVKRISWCPDYKVREDGKVLSLKRGKRRVLKPNRLKGGHLQVRLYNGGVKIDVLVHHLVMEAFIGPCPKGLEARHLDGNPSNNRPANLTWGTRQENMEDKQTHGTQIRGERIWTAKLTEATVKRLRRNGIPRGQRANTAKRLGVSIETIHSIMEGKTWKHVL